MPTHNYLSIISLNEFNYILRLHDIYVDENTQVKILRALRNNVYALYNETYQFVLEGYIETLASGITSQRIHQVINYFKPHLNV